MMAVPQRKQPVDAARWLESIAYALIALVGLAALGLVLFWRALHHWRRSADALEAAHHRLD
jgi:ABC-type nickel/cobalt efflux system permease component RcnA